MKFYGYPHRYYQRGKECDLKFVLSRMAVIPEGRKLEVSKKFESFRPWDGGEKRKAANIWLDTEARKYRNATSKKDDVLERVNAECNTPKSTAKEFKAKVDTITPPRKESYMDGLLNEVDKNHRKPK